MSRWNRTADKRAARTSAARLVVVVAALAGLFAMHGMSEHGVMHHSSTPMPAMTAIAVESATAGSTVAISAMDADLLRSAPEAATRSIGDADGDPGMAMMLCLAILIGMAVFFMRHRSMRAISAVREAVSVASLRIARRTREPDPPDLISLCIQRC